MGTEQKRNPATENARQLALQTVAMEYSWGKRVHENVPMSTCYPRIFAPGNFSDHEQKALKLSVVLNKKKGRTKSLLSRSETAAEANCAVSIAKTYKHSQRNAIFTRARNAALQ